MHLPLSLSPSLSCRSLIPPPFCYHFIIPCSFPTPLHSSSYLEGRSVLR